MRPTSRRSACPITVPGLRKKAQAFLGCLILVANSPSVIAQSAPAEPTPDEVVRLMVQRNELRAQELKYFTSVRHYHVDFHGLGKSMTADMHVQVSYALGSGKTFQVIDQSGSHLLLHHVLLKLLETEQNDSRQQQAVLTPSNYSFVFQCRTTEGGRTSYVFAVEPKVKNKLVYRGRIWIDAADYAVVRVEAQPAENPSFWIKKTQIEHLYVKNGDYWLPETNRSESKVRLGGSAVLTIDYGTYQFEKPHGMAPSSGTEVAARRVAQDAQ